MKDKNFINVNDAKELSVRDTARLIENLDLEEEFDVPKIKKLIR